MNLDWMQDALCKGLHSDFWFPPLEAPNQNAYYRIGKSLCYSCPVWKDCLEYGTKNEEVWGCWGGLTPQERRNPNRVPHGTIESKRFGCSCSACCSKDISLPISIDSIPRQGESYKLDDVVFRMSSK
jgi:WhiB family redox-sensing transcriptional regulator